VAVTHLRNRCLCTAVQLDVLHHPVAAPTVRRVCRQAVFQNCAWGV
jgi:hypothetical protein